MSFWNSQDEKRRAAALVLVVVMLFSMFYQTYQPAANLAAYDISSFSNILDAPIAQYADRLSVSVQDGSITFNKDYRPGSDQAGDNYAPKINAYFAGDGSGKMTVSDPAGNVSLSFVPKFNTLKPRKDQNRVVYPIVGSDAVKVYTLKGSGVKEDIILKSKPKSDVASYEYEVELSEGLEIRLESDGSLGVYGAGNGLLGNVSAVTDEDKELLKKARANADKNVFMFGIPAPVVLERYNKRSSAQAKFDLDGNILTLSASGLSSANYPLSIDPTVYVETARKLMRGNNETNIDFDVDNELIQKSQTTGARIDAWNSSLDMSESVWGHGTAAAGGYVYRTGGRTADTTAVTPPIVAGSAESLQSSNSSNFTMSMPGTRPAGDLYIAFMCHDGQSTSDDVSTAPAGWTEIANEQNNFAAYYKVGTDEGGGDEAASYTWSWGSNEKAGGAIIRVTGFDTGTPVSPTPTVNSGSGSTPTAPAITPSNDTTLVLRGYGIDNDEIGNSGWAPSGHTSVEYGGPTGNNDCAYAVASMDSAPSSGVSTGTASMQSGYVNDTYAAATVAINPAASIGSLPATVNTVEWAQFNSSSLLIESPTPSNTGSACSGWCNEAVYNLPEERRNHSMVAYNGYLYVIGGEDASGNIESTVYISKLGVNGEPSLWHPSDPDTNNWDYWYVDSGLSGGTGRTYLSAVAYNNRMYILGGKTTSTASASGVTTVEVADILPNGSLGSWTTSGMLALPSGAGNYMADAVIYNDTMYTVGGIEGGADSSSNLRATVYYSKINTDGTMNAWQATSGLLSARASFGGIFSYIWGGYLYMGGGCDAINASGYCTSIAGDVQIASINADGSLGGWKPMGNLDNSRIGYNFIGWQGGLYRLGGCSAVQVSDGECISALDSVDYGVVNPAGEVSTVSITDEAGEGDCTGGSPAGCDLPPAGDAAGQIGHMLSATTIVNGYLYVIGGCVTYICSDSSGNVAWTAVGADGSLQQPTVCAHTTVDSWCVDSTNQVNGTSGISAAGITVFNGRIYLVGGIDASGDGTTTIYNNVINADGSVDGVWETDTFASVGVTGEKAYTYAYARANPESASTDPGNLYIIGGCAAISASAGCANSYNTEVYKCDIETDGGIGASSCTTSGQLQLDVELGTEVNQGLGLHSGTVYANYIYLIGGYSKNVSDRDTVFYAKFDNDNNIVDAESGLVSGDDSDWIESASTLSIGRRRGWAFGYNGHIYAVGGYNNGGAGIIPFIEWAKEDVSDGSIGEFVTSSVEINQRWGLSMAVSNANAYVIGGCDVGSSPGGCTSFEPSIQIFQLYNNDSGATADFTAQTDQTFDKDTDRWGASSIVHDGHIYVAGGCTSATDCTNTTSSIQYAPISSADGGIGTWVSTGSSLPKNRAWGYLAVAGDTVYWVGGEDSSGDEKNDIFYSAIESAGGPAEDVLRTTQYKINGAEFNAATYTLTLNNDLSKDYFVMIAGATDNAGTTAADRAHVRVDSDPFGNIGTATASNEVILARGSATNNWVGVVTVVECLTACATEGFHLRQVVDQSLAAGSANTSQTTTVTLDDAHSVNTVPFGGYMGGGLSTTDAVAADFAVTAGVRIHKESTNELDIDRYGGGGRTPKAADLTIYVVEWGDEWDVQEVDIDNWNTGSSGLDVVGDYTTAAITPVTRDNTWLWKSPGTSEQEGLGDGAFGKVLALGDGTSTQNSTESTVAIGSYNTFADRDDTIYVMEHSGLANDYRFRTEANHGTYFSNDVDDNLGTETYSTAGNVDRVEGYRSLQFYHADNGTGAAYPRMAGWALKYRKKDALDAYKSFSGNNQAGWIQSTDFAGITYTPVDGDLADWSTASNSLPGDRTRFGADVWNDRIYVVGGLNDSGSSTNTVYVSPQLSAGGDIASAWSTSTGFNVAREGAAVTAYANNLYLFGGYDGSNYLSDSQFTQINTDGTVDSWTYTASLPNSLRDARAVSANGYIYLVGGRTADGVCVPKTLWVPISANTTIASGNNPTGVGEWAETNVRYTGDRYGAAVAYDDGKLYTMGGGCNSPLSSNRHYESTVKSQPQVAKYSRLIDTDTDVFPNSWLLNGLDNSIGARWSVRYRSMNDTDGVATDCGTSDMTTWGQETNFGDVTLGDVSPYIPLDGAGADTGCARYFYFFISIDASKTFGYPEDVNRGPTIADLSLFFTSDPNKRLRHGKTFTGGEQQPLDTPCRQSVDADCPLP